jgi:hypothetical protein
MLPDFTVLAPDLGDGGLVNAIADATFRLPKLIVWLDELQRFLPGPYFVPDEAAANTPIGAAAVRKLLAADTPVVLVGTLWPEYATQLRATDTDPAGGGNRPRHAKALDILGGAHDLRLDTFSVAEREAAAALAARDPRLAGALADRDYNVTEALAGARQIVLRYRQGTDAERAVVHAVVDARRHGVQGPLGADLLRDAARGYLTGARADDGWFDAAVAELTSRSRPVDRATAPLIALPTADRRGVLGYTVADYLLQRLTRERRSVRMSSLTWQALCSYVHEPADRRRLAAAARHRMLYQQAEVLYAPLMPGADLPTLRDFAGLLEGQGRVDDAADLFRPYPNPRVTEELYDLFLRHDRIDDALEMLRARADAGDGTAGFKLAQLLATHDRYDELRARADAGDDPATACLTQLLVRQGDLDELRARADAGDYYALEGIWELLLAQDRTAEALALLSQAAEAGSRYAAGLIVQTLAQTDAAAHRRALAAQAEAGNQYAKLQLAELAAKEGRVDEAVAALTALADGGDFNASGALARLLAAHDRLDELRARADAGDRGSVAHLADVLVARNGLDELRARADAGDWAARQRLPRLLVKLELFDEAIAALSPVADTGELGATYLRAKTLARAGRVDELRALADAGDRAAPEELAKLLAAEGRVVDLWDEVHAGTAGAGERLIELLAERGDRAAATRLRNEGIDPDGPPTTV